MRSQDLYIKSGKFPVDAEVVIEDADTGYHLVNVKIEYCESLNRVIISANYRDADKSVNPKTDMLTPDPCD